MQLRMSGRAARGSRAIFGPGPVLAVAAAPIPRSIEAQKAQETAAFMA
jgi:hypothetical protein